ncbi:MAG TPA: hypothetical protein VMZ74_03915 [Ramlibacter sp.]|nr:hypothetical protein [Ramlibacter sp.]
MRGRIVFIVLAVLVVGAIAALNWPEFTRAEPLSFGVLTATVPVGVTLLVIMAVVLAVFLVSSAIQESRYLLDHRRHTRALHAQRELAEKAEASRFTDLRQHLDSHLRETRQRETMMGTEFEKRMMQSHSELRAQLERMHQLIAGHLVEIESRLGPRDMTRVESGLQSDLPERDRARV